MVVAQVVLLFGSEKWGLTPRLEKISQGFPPPGSTADGRHGPQKSTGWDMGVTTHWGGAGNGGSGEYWGV